MTPERTSADVPSYSVRRCATAPAEVSVIICAYTEERWGLMERAVTSVLEQDRAPYEVVVVVDHNARLGDRLRDRFGDEVSVERNRHAQGLAGARNTGVAASSSGIVAFLDDDARAEQGWLAAHARHYRDDSTVGVGGTIRPDWQQGQPPWFPDEFAWVVGCTHAGIRQQVHEIRNPVGANMSFRRDAVVAAGGFRVGLGRLGTRPLGCEETELAIRLQSGDRSSRIIHEPEAVVVHHVPAQRTTWSYFTRRCWAEGLSKAQVSQYAGAREALSSERHYVARTLPAGLLRNLRAASTQRDHRPLARSGAIVAGLAVTTGGYLTGRAQATRGRSQG